MMFIALYLFSQLEVSHPHPSPIKKQRVSIAFTNSRDSVVPRSVVWTTSGQIAVADGPFSLRQWVPAWHGLLLCGDSGVFAWTRASVAPKLILDVAKLVPYVKSEFGTLTACVDNSGKKLAVYDDGGVTIIDIPSKRIIRRATGADVYKRLRVRSDNGPTENSGLAWSPDGTAIALTVSEAMESNDGTHRERCKTAT